MRTLSSTDLRAHLSSAMDQLNDDHEPVIVTRVKGKPVVKVSLEDWARLDEAPHLAANDPANKVASVQTLAKVWAAKADAAWRGGQRCFPTLDKPFHPVNKNHETLRNQWITNLSNCGQTPDTLL